MPNVLCAASGWSGSSDRAESSGGIGIRGHVDPVRQMTGLGQTEGHR
jgi:hypothetical protein